MSQSYCYPNVSNKAATILNPYSSGTQLFLNRIRMNYLEQQQHSSIRITSLKKTTDKSINDINF